MLIFPIDNKPDWNNPPVITILIIILNLGIFSFYQSQDKPKTDQAIRFYVQQNMAQYEDQLTRDYLKQHRPGMFNYIQNLQKGSEYQINLAALAFNLPELDDVVVQYWAESAIDVQQWQSARGKFEALRAEVSSYSYGLVPSDKRWYSFITYAFLHGGWDHIIGNMVFLFLFGFLLELGLGRFLYLFVYLFTGACAGVVFWYLNQKSMVPLIGASGAVSGLMGAYIAFYGLRKIRFFYTIGFYFGEIKAPAIAILPLWIAKEIYGYYFLNDQVAYSAHLGGLVFGAATLAGMKSISKKDMLAVTIVQSENTEDQAIKIALGKISAYSAKLDIEGGITCCQNYLKDYPEDVRLLEAYFILAKMKVNNKQFHQASFDILKRALVIKKHKSAANELIELVLSDYSKMASKQIVTKHDALMARVAHFFIANANERKGISIIEGFYESEGLSLEWAPALKAAIKYYNSRNASKMAQIFEEKLSKIKEP